jgi:hypothetical protein
MKISTYSFAINKTSLGGRGRISSIQAENSTSFPEESEYGKPERNYNQTA